MNKRNPASIKIRLLQFASFLVLLFLVATVMPSTASTIFDVTVGGGNGFQFVPSTVNISVGDTVRWTWAASGHSVTSGMPCAADSQFCSPNDMNCASGILSNIGTVYQHTFTQPGTYSYFCSAHCVIGMIGVVNVSGGCASGGWSAGPALPSVGVRLAGVYFQANGKFYGMGGRSSDSAGSDFTHPFEYDPATNSWTTKSATYPDNQVNNMACGVLAESGTPYIYCVGGSAATQTTATGRVFRYDPVTDTISAVASPWPGVNANAVLPGGFTVFQNKLYILGGFDVPAGTGTSQIWEFTPPTTWVQKVAVLPVPLGYIPTTTIGTLIYTGGGSDITGGVLSDTTNSFVYNPVADTIGTIPSIPRATAETRALNFNGQMLVMGGGRTAPNPSSEVDIYDPGTNTWTTGSPVPAFTTARRNFPTDTDGTTRIWLAGGYAPVSPTASMEIFCAGGPAQALSATINDSVTGTGINQWDFTSGGWFYYNNNSFTTAYQHDEHYAFTTGVKAHFRFNGTQVKIYTVKEPVGGNIRYTLDTNVDVQTVSNYSPTQVGNTLSYMSPVVSPGDHDLVIEVLGTHEPSASSNTITVDKAEVYKPATGQVLGATINDSVTGTGNNQWDYSGGGWNYYSNAGFTTAYQNDEHYAFTTGVKAHFRFNGTQVKIYTVKEPAGGNIRYTLDTNVDVQTVSNYSPTQVGNALSYTSPILNSGDHDLVIEVLGTHEPSASSNTITVDKAEVYVPSAGPVLSATINDSVTGMGNNQWDYGASGWSYYSNTGFTTAYQNDEHYAFTTGVKAHFRFNGTQVRIYTVKEPAGGNIRYTLDTNADIQTVSNYSPIQIGNALSYTSPVVSAGNHDLVIEVLGTHEPSASSNTITVDKAEVYTGP